MIPNLKKAFNPSNKKVIVLTWLVLIAVFFGLIEVATRAYWALSNQYGPCMGEMKSDEFGTYCAGLHSPKTFGNFDTIWGAGIWNGVWWSNHIMGFSIVIVIAALIIAIVGLYMLAVELVYRIWR